MAPGNPCALSNTFLAYAFRDADPGRALKALRRSLVTARDNGNSLNESRVAVIVSRLEAECDDPPAAFEQSTVAITYFHDSGNTAVIRSLLRRDVDAGVRLHRRHPGPCR